MINGLIVSLSEFKRMKVREQMSILFENQQKTMKLMEGYKFWQKLNAWITGILVTGMSGLWGIIIFR